MTMVDISRIVVSTLTVGALGISALAVAQEWSPFESETVELSTIVTPEAVTRNLSCTGAAIASVADSTQWTQLGATDVALSGGAIAGSFTTDSSPTGAIIAHDGDPNAVVAAESIELFTDNMVGFLATECSDALNSAWLVGGSTETGRDAVLTISNPARVDARVDLEFYGAEGFIEAPASRGIIVPAGAQRSYSLAGFAPNESSPVIHVVSNGAPVWATLQVSTVRGLVPGGLDRITAVDEPATVLSIPLIREPDAEVIGPLRSEPGYDDTETMVRLFVPGSEDATITMTFTPHASDDEPFDVTTEIAAQKVVDIPVAELHDGDFTVTITSTTPLFATARVSSHNMDTEVTDVAWAPALAASNQLSAAAIPFRGTLAISNPQDTEVSVVVTANGVESTVIVGAFGTTPLTVKAGSVYLRSDSPYVSTIFIETPNGIAVIRPRPAPLGAQAVTVIAH
jgi:hypothetical protein